MSVQLFTIGFAQTSAEHFFELLRGAGVKRIIDVRLNNTSQLAGFTKKEDLQFFLHEVAGIDYVHVPELAPTQGILDAYKKHKGSWAAYEREFNALMAKREVENVILRETAHLGCLLCSEKEPHHCHRRLVAEHLQKHWSDVSTKHLV
ncbi:MAG: DUF488 domain-containing protein [Phycisphaeraceae bacterium]|nr:DUF488 domain-containing protein [Phycisphaeraceae bacterium]